jgi:cytochrome c oxidase assembly protein subunit 15
LTLLGTIAWLASQHNEQVPLTRDAHALRFSALLALLALAIQIALGGWVSTNYATLACTEYPMCQGGWIPNMDFANGFTLWRDLGKTGNGEFLPFAALTAIHFVHRNFALVVAVCAGWVGYRATQIAGLAKLGRWLMAVLALQIATGISTIFLSFPLLLAVAHNGGAAALVILLVMINYRTRNPAATGSNLST